MATGVHAGGLSFSRFIQLLFILVALGLIADTKPLWFKKHHSFEFLLAANSIAFIYVLAVFLLAVVKLCGNDKQFEGGMGWSQLVMDGVIGFLLLAAACAAAGAIAALKTDLYVGKDPICKGVLKDVGAGRNAPPCTKTEGSIAFTFLSAFGVMATHWWLVHGMHRQ
eukprot:TRINITY_DN211_c0_g1_i1.p1 TRINITY_DN211_c0_g1~~TRINITY_DN211_c0_g1_i1.p1  ORF type:complete len:167 (-),score=21.48 TRINITY_DN211_c0_g1_i1:587-1087(-)